MILDDGAAFVVEIPEGERRRCPCEKKIKLTEEHRIETPRRRRLTVNRRVLVIGCIFLTIFLASRLVWSGGDGQISIRPTALEFGAVPVSGKKSLELEIRNTGKGKLKIRKTSIDGSQFSMSSRKFTIQPGRSRHVKIEFSPSSAGSSEGILKVVCDATGQKEVAIQLAGSGGSGDAGEILKSFFGPLDEGSKIRK